MRRLLTFALLTALAACAPRETAEPPPANENAAPPFVDPTGDVPYDLQAVEFVSVSHGWVVGSDVGNNVSVVLRTTDGGATWNLALELVGDTLLDVDFVDERTGWMVGTSGVVYATTDGGRTVTPEPPGSWPAVYDRQPSSALINESIASIFFVDPKTGWAAGDAPTGQEASLRGLVLGTGDGGRTWRELKDRSGKGAPFSINDVWFTSATDGWAAGGNLEDNEEDVLLRTTDGGRTWERRPTGAAEYLRAVQFVDRDHGWVVGMTVDTVDPSGPPGPSKILATSDGGATWVVQLTAPRSFYDVLFVDALHGWAVGDRAAIYATTDGGRTWRQQSRFTKIGSKVVRAPAPDPKAEEPRALRTVFARDAADVWAGGEGVVLRRK
jgi:photosystem II stability/assembly factor-like uncharacterized protein